MGKRLHGKLLNCTVGILLMLAGVRMVEGADSFVIQDAVLLESSSNQRADHLIPLGTVKEGRDGRVMPERAERAAGKSTKTLFQLPSELNVNEARVLLTAMAKAQGDALIPLYTCTGRDCGQSTLWANDVFGEPLLSGNEHTQFAAVFVAKDKQTLTMLYASERGNRRSHYVVDVVQLTSPWTMAVPPVEPVKRLHWRLAVLFDARGNVNQPAMDASLRSVTNGMRTSQTTDWAVVAHGCLGPDTAARFTQAQAILDALLPNLRNIPGKSVFPVNVGNVYPEFCQGGKSLEIIEIKPQS